MSLLPKRELDEGSEGGGSVDFMASYIGDMEPWPEILD